MLFVMVTLGHSYTLVNSQHSPGLLPCDTQHNVVFIYSLTSESERERRSIGGRVEERGEKIASEGEEIMAGKEGCR